MKKILNYFPYLSDFQIRQLYELKLLYLNWNSKINVISRKTIDVFYQNHVLHSLAIAKVMKFKPKTRILDLGTGGGFPGIPLAILFPESNFLLVDSINKKIKVVENICKIIKLRINTKVIRAEKLNEKFDFILGRGVTNIEKFSFWIYNLFKQISFNDLENGLLYLKGGDLTKELSYLNKIKPIKNININYKIYSISDFYYEEFFKKKYIVYINQKTIYRLRYMLNQKKL